MALKLASVVLFAVMAVCVKRLGHEIPAGQTIFVRGVISALVLVLIAWRTDGLYLLKPRNWRSHALRSVSGTLSMFCLFASLTMAPLADVTAIMFTAPLIVTVFAMVFLRENIHSLRWTALSVGFLGVLIMIGPQLSFGGDASLGVLTALPMSQLDYLYPVPRFIAFGAPIHFKIIKSLAFVKRRHAATKPDSCGDSHPVVLRSAPSACW